jgi:hypothetical protein
MCRDKKLFFKEYVNDVQADLTENVFEKAYHLHVNG